MGTIGRHLFVKGGYAGDVLPQVLDAVRQTGANVALGGTVFDIGANIGTVVIPAVRRHGYDRGVAFEAHPDNAHVLRLNVLHSRLAERVQVVEAALGAACGVVSMKARGKSGIHRVLPHAPAKPGGDGSAGRVSVRLASLDELAESGEIDDSAVTLLWLDVQGYEAQVLAGASRVLREPPLVVTEFSPRHLDRYDGLDQLIDLAVDSYTHVVDVRTTLRSKQLRVHPVSRLRSLAEELGEGFTDLALVRLRRP